MLSIEPPDPAVHSDEDSADEDEGGLINNLTGRQLNAGCEVVLVSTHQTHSVNRQNFQVPSDIESETGPSSESSRGSHAVSSRGSHTSCRRPASLRLSEIESKAGPSSESSHGSH